MDKNLNIGKGKTNTSTCDRIINKEGNIVTGDAVLATFDEFYVSIGQDLAKKFTIANNICSAAPPVDVRKQCSFRFIGIREVKSVVNGLKNNKSTCVNDIYMKILKEAVMMLLVELTHLINECLDMSIMPQEWKLGTVSPIPKVPPPL